MRVMTDEEILQECHKSGPMSREVIHAEMIGDGHDDRKKSRISVGKSHSVSVTVDQHFNRFQKLMLKACFGFDVDD